MGLIRITIIRCRVGQGKPSGNQLPPPVPLHRTRQTLTTPTYYSAPASVDTAWCAPLPRKR